MVAVAGPPEHVALQREAFRDRRILRDRGSLTGRVLLAGRTVQIPDMLSDPDYVGIGPFFATGSKSDAGEPIGPEGFSRLAAAAGLPAVAVGGVTAENAAVAMSAGAAGIAVIGGVFASTDPAAAARRLRSAIGI